jgi:hypothetical protein
VPLQCVTISLAKNDFKTLVPVGTLPQFLPRLKVSRAAARRCAPA